MRLGKALVLSGYLFLAACAGRQPAAPVSPPSEGYVEIPNPAFTMSAGQPATIWVPRSYVESGPPRAGELVKQGIDKVFPPKADQQRPPQASSGPQPPANPSQQTATVNLAYQQPSTGGFAQAPVLAPVVPVALKHRMVILEIGQNGLVQPLQDQLRRAGIGIIADPAQAAFLAQSATLTGPEGKSTFALRLQQEYNVNEVIFVGAADRLAPGKTVTAEVYDAMGGGLLRGLDAVIPSYKETDQAARNAAVAEALAGITAGVKELVPLLPWYSRISAVNGNRAYIPAGKEAGLKVGQALKVYRGGKVVKGLGFAPGSKIGMLEVDGFVGPNGAFCAIREGQGIEASDVVSAE